MPLTGTQLCGKRPPTGDYHPCRHLFDHNGACFFMLKNAALREEGVIEFDLLANLVKGVAIVHGEGSPKHLAAQKMVQELREKEPTITEIDVGEFNRVLEL